MLNAMCDNFDKNDYAFFDMNFKEISLKEMLSGHGVFKLCYYYIGNEEIIKFLKDYFDDEFERYCPDDVGSWIWHNDEWIRLDDAQNQLLKIQKILMRGE